MNASDPRIGTQIGGYLLEAYIGRGGMGVVYRAEDQQPGTRGRKVAIKLLVPELSADERFTERFRYEAQVAASIDHPNIIPIYGAGEEDGVLFIAMRYVEGVDLHGYLQEEGPLPAEMTLGIIGQVAAALDVAHARGLVHRDIKPGNILLVPEPDPGEKPHVYLTDFGLTKQVRAQGGLTQVGQFVGTIDYVAPEQIQGKEVDPRTDIYAMGCVFYQALTGEPPFRREEEAAALWAHLGDPPPRLSDRRPELGTAIDEVLARALAKSPEDRYASCREFVSAARRAVGAQPAPSVGVTRAAPTYPDPTPAAGTPAYPTGPGAAPSYPAPYPPSYPTAEPPGRRRTMILASIAGALLLAAVLLVVFLVTRPPPEESFPNANERQLLSVIPSEVQTPTCSRGERPSTASAAVQCPDGAQRYTFVQYPAASSMNAAYNSSLAASAVRADTGLDQCEQGNPGEGEWFLGEEEEPSGRALCYRAADGAAVFEWTHDRYLIHAVAVRPDGNLGELRRVWAEELPDYGA